MTTLNYVLLAAFSFALIAACLILYDRLKRSRNADEGGTIRDKEQRLFKLYQNLEDLIVGMEEYVEDAKEEFKKERQQLDERLKKLESASEREAIRESIPAASHGEGTAQAQIAPEELRQAIGGEFPPLSISMSSKVTEQGLARQPRGQSAANTRRKSGKVEDVRGLHGQGLSEEQIAKKLNLSIAEVGLIIGMLSS